MLPAYAAVHAAVLELDPMWWKAADQGSLAAVLGSLLPNVIELPALASIAVAWHRLILRGERVTGAICLRLDRVVWAYVLILFAFLVLGFAPMVVAASRPALHPWLRLASAASLAVMLLLLPRLSLMLPGVALSERLSAAWRATAATAGGLPQPLCSAPCCSVLCTDCS
jgi:hypothetical protein